MKTNNDTITIKIKRNHVTAQGLTDLQNQLEGLRERRRQVTQELADIASQSTQDATLEDSTFAHNHNQATDLDNRIAELEHIIRTADIIDRPSSFDRVQLGSKVTVDLEGQEKSFAIVSPLEADPLNGKISDESPFGLSIIGKKLNELVQIVKPNKQKATALILRIE